MTGLWDFPDVTNAELVEQIIVSYNLCRPEDNHPHGDYRSDHGHTDCWLLGMAIERLVSSRSPDASGAVLLDKPNPIEYPPPPAPRKGLMNYLWGDR